MKPNIYVSKVLSNQGNDAHATFPHVEKISIVIPVYRGERTLLRLVEEIAAFTMPQVSRSGRLYRVAEVILVSDGATDGSPQIIRALAAEKSFVKPIWLSRNFGQHPATLAGMASSVCDWVVTMDEDGQQNPADIEKLLDMALDTKAHVVYAAPAGTLPHNWLRNAGSKTAKWVFGHLLGNRQAARFNSFRLIRGEIARSLAAYCGNNVYLDGALYWVADNTQYCPLQLRPDGVRSSGYSYPKLFDHFIRLIFTSRWPPLRIVSFLGGFSLLFSFGMAGYALWGKLSYHVPVQGWTSLTILISFFSGAILFCCGVMAEYLGILLTMLMGKPLYLIISDPESKVTPLPASEPKNARAT